MKQLVRNIILLHATKHSAPCRLGRKKGEMHIVLDYILLVLKSAMAWRHLKYTKCPYDYRTIHRYFRQWTVCGVFKDAYLALYRLYRAKRRSKYHCIDSSYVKSIYGRDGTGRNPTDRGRQATKLSAIVDDLGVPHALYFCTANMSDYRTVEATCDRILSPHHRVPIYAGKGYDSRAARAQFRAYNYIDRVGKRRVHTHSVVNRRRGIIERFFGWLDKCRRLILRYDAYLSSYEAWTWLACCRIIHRRL